MAQRSSTYTLSQLAESLNGTLLGDDCVITGLNTLEKAKATELSFIANPRYISQLSQSNAGAVLVTKELAAQVKGVAVVVDNPYLAFAKSTQLFDWREQPSDKTSTIAEAVISPTAVVGARVKLGRGVKVCAGVVIEDDVELGDCSYIGPNSVVQSKCQVGEFTYISANVTLYPDVHIGSHCLIHSGAVIGADGFGFAPAPQGWEKICQLGGVRIGNSVEVGANTTIDRGALDHTYIHDGVKLDNQIQIAHNVTIGEQTAIAGCTAVAGSTKIGRHCTIAGHCGITGHLVIADHTHITAMSLISKSITASGQAFSSGTGQETHGSWKRNVVRFRQLDDMSRRLKQLEQQVENISIEGLNK